MNAKNPHPDFEILLELLAERTCRQLTPAEDAQLEKLLGRYPNVDRYEIDRLAAAVELSLSPVEFEPLPPALRRKILFQAEQILGELQPSAAPEAKAIQLAPQSARATSRLAWLVAAASILLAILAWSPRWAPLKSNADLRAELLQSKDLVRARLADPVTGVDQGDVVWSPAVQKGYLRIKRLAVNKPSQSQYQLWIFDKNQDERYPIDGGVFNIDRTSGEVVVPIHAALRVTDPMLFAVTAEKPGGVVVSSREQLKLIAKVGG